VTNKLQDAVEQKFAELLLARYEGCDCDACVVYRQALDDVRTLLAQYAVVPKDALEDVMYLAGILVPNISFDNPLRKSFSAVGSALYAPASETQDKANG